MFGAAENHVVTGRVRGLRAARRHEWTGLVELEASSVPSVVTTVITNVTRFTSRSAAVSSTRTSTEALVDLSR